MGRTSRQPGPDGNFRRSAFLAPASGVAWGFLGSIDRIESPKSLFSRISQPQKWYPLLLEML
jgi:hypothetical protein